MHIFDWIASRWVERNGPFFCLVLLYTFTHIALAEQPGVQPVPTSFDAGTLGTPAGIQLVVDGPQGAFTAILGPALSDQLRQTLLPGAPVQVSGVKETINGQSCLLARKLTVAGNQVIIRNEHGFLVHSQQRSRASVNNSVLSPGAK